MRAVPQSWRAGWEEFAHAGRRPAGRTLGKISLVFERPATNVAFFVNTVDAGVDWFADLSP